MEYPPLLVCFLAPSQELIVERDALKRRVAELEAVSEAVRSQSVMARRSATTRTDAEAKALASQVELLQKQVSTLKYQLAMREVGPPGQPGCFWVVFAMTMCCVGAPFLLSLTVRCHSVLFVLVDNLCRRRQRTAPTKSGPRWHPCKRSTSC